MTTEEFNALAERANTTLHVDHVEALQQAAARIRKGSPIGVFNKQEAFRAHGQFFPARTEVIPAILVGFDGEMHASACETDEAHRMRYGFHAAKTMTKRTTDVYLYDLRALPGTRFKGAPRKRR